MPAAEALIQTALLGEAIESGPALVFVADEEMRYIAVNQFACDSLGQIRCWATSRFQYDTVRFYDGKSVARGHWIAGPPRSARCAIARSHIRRMRSLPGWMRRQ